jgi:Holliday junction resolvase-like predicted endonuclease
MALAKTVNSIVAYKTGLEGEKIAVEFYRTIGYELLKSRLKTKAGEIDLVFINHDLEHLIFTEVKATKLDNMDYENIISKKQWARIFAAAELFIYNDTDCYQKHSYSFDAIYIKQGKMAHRTENIFLEDVL